MISLDVILKNVLGDLDVNFIIAFYIYVVFGLLFNMLIHYVRKQVKDKKVSRHKPFNFKLWIKDNTVRFLVPAMCVFLFIRFYGKFNINYELDMWLGLLVGMGLDNLVIFVRNRTNVNIFQAKQS